MQDRDRHKARLDQGRVALFRPQGGDAAGASERARAHPSARVPRDGKRIAIDAAAQGGKAYSLIRIQGRCVDVHKTGKAFPFIYVSERSAQSCKSFYVFCRKIRKRGIPVLGFSGGQLYAERDAGHAIKRRFACRPAGARIEHVGAEVAAPVDAGKHHVRPAREKAAGEPCYHAVNGRARDGKPVFLQLGDGQLPVHGERARGAGTVSVRCGHPDLVFRGQVLVQGEQSRRPHPVVVRQENVHVSCTPRAGRTV